jgi:protein-L-isoaspartate(D-aspartate) O-methyltransferase
MPAMDDLDARAARHRKALVEVLRGRGVVDPVLRAFAAVPRHRFVDRFSAPPPGALPDGGHEAREYVIDGDADEAALEVAHAPDVALITAGPAAPGQATSSVSAPGLVAAMLAELDLEPGLRVLEIGAGSGYNAALIATLVGDPSLVATVDIDPSLVERTQARLRDLGFGEVSVVGGDGDEGFAAGAPYDRIVATVGCADIAPAWTQQLTDSGVMLVPLVHGAAHPRVRLTKDGDGLAGQFVGHSGFVSIQGEQAGQSPWPECRPSPPADAGARTEAVPQELLPALGRGDPSMPMSRPGEWALALYLALRDSRAGFGASLAAGDAGATISRGRLLLTGPADDLAQDLLRLAEEWRRLGAPGLDRYGTSFVRRARAAPHLAPPSPPTGPWYIRRLRHLQAIHLRART